MKWIYGKRDWETLKRGQENCYLMTNQLGGFSSLTMTGSVARNDHAVFMACTQAPNHRYNMVHRLAEKVIIGTEEDCISSQEFAKEDCEKGYQYLSAFTYEDTPVWKFQIKGVTIHKEMGMKIGANSLGICYKVYNGSQKECILKITPFFQFTKKGDEMNPEQKFVKEGNKVSSEGLNLYVRTNGTVIDIPEITENYYYSYDACDGRRPNGLAKANHEITITVKPSETKELNIVFEMEQSKDTAADIINGVKKYRADLVQRAGFTDEIAKTLVKSAAQFISYRESTEGDTILAGFPFFEDWGRDTMIALPGVCLATKQYETAKSILRTFAANEKDGLMPNLFPEGKSEPRYNTVDAALLFINCVYLYYQTTKEEDFVCEMYPVMERIMNGYTKGTNYEIHMDEDGLIMAGKGFDQVTWMDVRVGDILPTPRHGKPVEVNAYWYNALCIMSSFAALLQKDAQNYQKLAEKVKASFVEKFWMEDKNCLKDVLSGTAADNQIRCNQIWAVSMPFTMLDETKEKKVVDKVYELLYTPYGLRTLEKNDPQFHPHYGGEMLDRDLAYHQGTVWVFPLGAYYLAYLKVHHYDDNAKQVVKGQLEVMESAMREGCIGQLPEIYDGENPTVSRGCFAQAWSVGEMLRVYEKLQ